MDKETRDQRVALWIQANPRTAKLAGWLTIITFAAMFIYIGWDVIERIKNGRIVSALLKFAALSLYFWERHKKAQTKQA